MACWGDVDRDEALVDLEELDSLIERPHLICRENPDCSSDMRGD